MRCLDSSARSKVKTQAADRGGGRPGCSPDLVRTILRISSRFSYRKVAASILVVHIASKLPGASICYRTNNTKQCHV